MRGAVKCAGGQDWQLNPIIPHRLIDWRLGIRPQSSIDPKRNHENGPASSRTIKKRKHESEEKTDWEDVKDADNDDDMNNDGEMDDLEVEEDNPKGKSFVLGGRRVAFKVRRACRSCSVTFTLITLYTVRLELSMPCKYFRLHTSS